MATDPSWHDVLAIRAVLDRYASGIDRRDWDLFASCFTEDVVADYGRNGRYDNRNSFVLAFDEMHRPPVGRTLHRITNHDITVTGDTAHAVSYFDAMLEAEHKGFQFLHAIGTYTDELRRGDDGWRISRRVTETVMFRRERDKFLD
ncbi:MAG: nuclear transport factor 2 family protein [Acidimicrobiia bacterium]